MQRDEDRPRSSPARRRDEDDDDRPARRDREPAAEQPSTGPQLGLGIPSLVVGILAGLFALIPCVGMISLPFSIIALLLGLIGLLIAAFRKWRGVAFPAAGSVV